LVAASVLLMPGLPAAAEATAPSPTKAAPSQSIPAPPDAVVYDDALAPGWASWSWATTVDFASTAAVAEGTNAIAVTYTGGWSGLYLHTDTPVDTSRYSHLRFWINGGDGTGQNKISLKFAAGGAGVVDYTIYAMPSGWLRVEVPLAELGSPATVQEIVLQEASGAAQPTFYLDRIEFTAQPAPPVTFPPTAQGLRGEYFALGTFFGLMSTRLDEEVSFDWGANPPDPAITRPNYSVRWSGQLRPAYSEEYTFNLDSFGGGRLWINNELVVNNWFGVQESQPIKLVAGRAYNILIEFESCCGGGAAKLEWSSASQPRSVVTKEFLKPVPALVATLALPQTGWAPRAEKLLGLATSGKISDPRYRIYRDGKVVRSGSLADQGLRWGTRQYMVDISTLRDEGHYAIVIGANPGSPSSAPLPGPVNAPTGCRANANATICDEYAQGVFDISRAAYRSLTSGAAHIGIPDMLAGFWAAQRCTPQRCGDDSNLTRYRKVAGGADELVPGTSGDLNGGWKDATSTDKETISIGLAVLSMGYVLERSPDPATTGPLITEIKWGIDYLLRLQDADGAFPLAVVPAGDATPRRVFINQSTGVTARVAAALAEAATVLKSSDPALAESCLAAARRAWTWVFVHPDQFQRAEYGEGWTGSAGTVLGAAVELARATGEAPYSDYVETTIGEGAFTGTGNWTKIDGTFPGQSESPQEQNGDAQPAIALARYAKLASSQAVRERIVALTQQYVDVWKASMDNPYRVGETNFVPWFGFAQDVLSSAQNLANIGAELGNAEAMKLALKQFEWTVGFNPLGSSFFIGVGRPSIVAPFNRTVAETVGAVLPGMKYINGHLSTFYDRPWNEWTVGETGLGSSSALDALAIFNQTYGH
jgi:hypothetical protein